jgi:hypothetical protein
MGADYLWIALKNVLRKVLVIVLGHCAVTLADVEHRQPYSFAKIVILGWLVEAFRLWPGQ